MEEAEQEAEQGADLEELGVAKAMLSVAGAMRKAAKVAEVAGVAEAATQGLRDRAGRVFEFAYVRSLT